MRHFDQVADSPLDGQITFIKERSHGIIISVAPQNKHRQIIGSDGIAVNEFIEAIRQKNIGRNFRHEEKFEVRAAFQSFFSHNCRYFFRFINGAAERNHAVQIFQAIFFTDFSDRFQFQAERIGVFRIIVTGSASPAEKISRFFRFILIAALEISVFTGFEIGEAENNGTGSKSTAYFADAFCKHIHHFFRTACFN